MVRWAVFKFFYCDFSNEIMTIAHMIKWTFWYAPIWQGSSDWKVEPVFATSTPYWSRQFIRGRHLSWVQYIFTIFTTFKIAGEGISTNFGFWTVSEIRTKMPDYGWLQYRMIVCSEIRWIPILVILNLDCNYTCNIYMLSLRTLLF